MSCQNNQTISKNCLRVCFVADPVTIDPKRSGDFTSSTLICLLYEGLMRCKSGSEIELGAAERIDISRDGKTYRFFLKKTFWTDGKPVTAYDFENSWKTILSPGFPSLCAYLLYPIKNAEKYAKGACKETEVGIHSIDAQTLVVELENPTPYFLSLTAFPLYMPTPSHLKDLPLYGSNEAPLKVVCNGPFSLSHVKPGSEIRLKKNSAFWNKSQVHLDEIHISIVASDLTALQLFEKEELDMVGGSLMSLSSDLLANLTNDARLQHLPMAASTFCTLNTKSFPLHNLSLRAAFQKAIENHPYLLKEIENNGHIPAQTILPPSLSLKQKKEKLHTPDRAREFLKQACEQLQITPKELETLTLYYGPNSIEKKIALTLQKIWFEVLGISIQIQQMEGKSLVKKLYVKNYQMAIFYWIAQFHDPINILERFKDPNNPKNYPGWDLEIYQNILNASIGVTEPLQREQMLRQAEQILEEEKILIPLYHWKNPLLLHPRVQQFVTTDSGGLLIEKCYIENNTIGNSRTDF